jgi:catechol 2,3-dioxygenase-like lactoylglutathione lyase family enzyme
MQCDAGYPSVTAIVGDPLKNFVFYTRDLGLRFIKKPGGVLFEIATDTPGFAVD